MKNLSAILPVLLLTFLSCNNNHRSGVYINRPGSKEMAELNSYFVEKDRERIASYIERKHLDMKESGSGLWYCIKSEGKGSLLKDKDHIVVDYTCSLLDETPCYSSEKLGPKNIVLGRSDIEPGLNEGLRMLRHGSEAIFILPPFLAYGVPGDNKSIPPRATLVYEIKIRE